MTSDSLVCSSTTTITEYFVHQWPQWWMINDKLNEKIILKGTDLINFW